MDTHFLWSYRQVTLEYKAEQVRLSLSERKKLMATRVIRRFISRALAHAFDGWHEFVLERKRKIHLSVGLLTLSEMRKEKEAFSKWEEFVKQQNPHRFFDDMMHLASLLHATACMSLRSRWHSFSRLVLRYRCVIVTRKWLYTLGQVGC